MKHIESEGDTYIGNTEKELLQFISTVQQRIQELLGEADIKVVNSSAKAIAHERLKLRGLTAFITIEDNAKMAIMFSYEERLIYKIFQEYTKDIEISEEEEDLMIEETAGDFINVVIGNILAKFQKVGQAIELSIPLVINGARSIKRFKKAKVCHASIETEFGNISVYCMVPIDVSLFYQMKSEVNNNEQD